MAQSKKAAYRQKLEKLKDAVLGEISEQKSHSLRMSNREASGDLSGYSIHMADVGTDNYDTSFALGLVTSESELLEEIEEAIYRLEKGKFGSCEECGKKINSKRLDAIPFARLCIDCQRKKEQQNKVSRG